MKKKILNFALAICMILPAMFALTACGHSHEFSDVWSSDETYHWHACTGEDCTETADNDEHTFVVGKNETGHWQVCSVCGYKKNETAHVLVTKHSEEKHWQECDCGYKTEEVVHTFDATDFDGENHWKKCACGQTKDVTPHNFKVNETKVDDHVLGCHDCEYVSGALEHTYEEDSQTTCDNCSHERNQATLAFKSGTYVITYDGLAHAFDKATLAEVTHANLDEVVVEYKLSGSADWTTEAPVNAGTYSIRLSVSATKDHTSAEATQEFVISPIMLDISNFERVYTLAETTNSSKTFDVTSADIAGILSSDTLKIRIFRNANVEITEGSCYALKSILSASNDDAFRVQILDNKNYQISGSTSGKLYVTKEATSSGEGTSVSPYTYTAEATIAKDGIVYYTAKPVRTRTGTDNEFAVNFDVTLSDSDARIVDVYTKSNFFTVKLTNDGTLVTYGVATSSPMTIYFVVEYKGDSESKKVTLTLTQSYAKTTIENTTALTNALNLDNASQYHVTLKEDDSVIEENKIDKTEHKNKFYKNNNKTEVYYQQYNAGTSFLKYSKNTAGKWVRELVFADSSSKEDSISQANNATKFSSALLNAFSNLNELTFENVDQMYHVNSFDVEDDTYTNVALKFKDGKLIYAEYELNEKKYTIEIEYDDPNIVCPTDYIGVSLTNPITASFIRTTQKFSTTGMFVMANVLTYYEFEVTDAVIKAYSGSDDSTCSVQGSVTADKDAILTINAYQADGKTKVTNNTSDNGKLILTDLTAGKYVITVSSNTECTISLSMEKHTISVVS